MSLRDKSMHRKEAVFPPGNPQPKLQGVKLDLVENPLVRS